MNKQSHDNEHGKIGLCLVGPYSDKDPSFNDRLDATQIDKDTLFPVVDMCSTFAEPWAVTVGDTQVSEAFVDRVMILI